MANCNMSPKHMNFSKELFTLRVQCKIDHLISSLTTHSPKVQSSSTLSMSCPQRALNNIC